MQTHLSEHAELATLDSPHCPQCGLALEQFAGTQDSEVLEIEVKAYRRVIQRHPGEVLPWPALMGRYAAHGKLQSAASVRRASPPWSRTKRLRQSSLEKGGSL